MERLGETHVCKTLEGAVRSITNIYSLVQNLFVELYNVHKIRGTSRKYRLSMLQKAPELMRTGGHLLFYSIKECILWVTLS